MNGEPCISEPAETPEERRARIVGARAEQIETSWQACLRNAGVLDDYMDEFIGWLSDNPDRLKAMTRAVCGMALRIEAQDAKTALIDLADRYLGALAAADLDHLERDLAGDPSVYRVVPYEWIAARAAKLAEEAA